MLIKLHKYNKEPFGSKSQQQEEKEKMKAIKEQITTQYELKKSIGSDLVDSVVDAIIARVASGEKLLISGLGSFSLLKKPARKARNPKTGESVDVAAKTVVKFSAAKAIKEAINK
jgi:DNA-binding protein HU-beta